MSRRRSTNHCSECQRPFWPLRGGLCQRCYERHRRAQRREDSPSGLNATLLGPAAYYRTQAERCRSTGYPNTAETYDELAAMAERAEVAA